MPLRASLRVALSMASSIDGRMSAAVVAPLMSRMEVDRDGNTHVEFRIKERTPVNQETGVLISRKWLGH